MTNCRSTPVIPEADRKLIDRAARLIAAADALIVTAGAGIGVDSGLPDFRGSAGFWTSYPALGRARIDFQSIASPAAFHADPRLAWGFYGHRLALYRRTVPHAGCSILKRWGESKKAGYSVFTSNVDGQFHRAGFEHARIHECHGSIHYLQCLAPCDDDIWSADGFEPDVDDEACRLRSAPPACPRCGGLARPNVLMFGDDGWIDTRSAQQVVRLRLWLQTISRPVVVELGAGTAIPSVRRFGEFTAHSMGGHLIRINPREPAVHDSGDVGLPMNARAALEAIDAALAG